MRHPIILAVCMAGVTALAGCGEKDANATVERAFKDVNVVDETNLSDVMLTVADPNEAVSYFARSVKESPDRIDHQRGLAASRAETVLNSIPPTHETFARYRLEAMVADSKEQWSRADSFYEIAVGLTTTPAAVMNNWGYSKLTRGDYPEAERLFGEAIRQDNTLFTAKNNLIMARAAQRDYTLPVMPMEQSERAQLLHTMALSAIKRGDVETGKGLLREAIDTHPQHFEAAVRSLRALENG